MNNQKILINKRINKLRQLMKEHHIDAYLILSNDFHSSEYVCDYFKCREYISGFTGSAGTVVVTENEICLFTDGRYFLQAQEQLKGTEIILQKIGEEGVPDVKEYLKDVMEDGQTLGYDGRTVPVKYAESLKEYLQDEDAKKIHFREDVDLIHSIWADCPKISSEPIWELEEKYAGKSRSQKLKDLREKMSEQSAQAMLISSLDDIAWLYNFRGNDIAYSPLFLAYTLVFGDHAVLYVNEESISKEMEEFLKREQIFIKPYFAVYDDLKSLGNITLWIDTSKINVALNNSISRDVQIIDTICPTTTMKAVKNLTEIENERYAHILDGVAVTKMIYRIKEAVRLGKTNYLTELDICEQLEDLRKRGDGYLGQSFSPIVATGAHGAIVHYEPTKETNIPIENNNFLLMDTGGHYLYGTTDITRTVAIGKLTEEQKRYYTAVLRGHLNLGAAKFEYGLTGNEIDYLARNQVKESGLDYKHGTGHGVGYLLSVHEGPQSIRPKEPDGKSGTVLEAGMITSNEPGVYLEGQYGIRIENLILCKEDEEGEYCIRCENTEKTNSQKYLSFEHLTLVPYERDAILPEMMTERELKLLNDYQKKVYEKIHPYLAEEEKKWLKEQTMKIEKEK